MEALDKDLSLLISINDDIASIQDSQNLFLSIFRKLHDFYELKIVGLALIDKSPENLGVIIAKFDEQKKMIDSFVWQQAYSTNSLPFELSLADPVITEVDSKYFYSMQPVYENQPSLGDVLEESAISKFMFLPMKTGGELIGYLVFATEEYIIKKKDHEYSLKIANLMVDLVTIKETDALHIKLAGEINKFIPCEFIAIYAEESVMNNLSKVFALTKGTADEFKLVPVIRNLVSSVRAIKSKIEGKTTENFIEITGEEFEKLCSQFPHIKQLKEKNGINSFLALQYAYENLGELNLILGRSNPFLWMNHAEKVELVFSQNTNTFFARKEVELGLHILPQLGMILANLYAFEEIKILTKKLEQEKNFLLDEINLSNSFQEIIGDSQAIQNSLNKVKQVAPLEATVLIQGETGTGKELVARAVHNLSKRKENAFITINCAALPSQLIESELFGHERGSFTGAVEKRIGKFEVADGGTIFLDEIGELPLEIQSKLLRVLQEKEFERLGGKSTIRSDVRIVAATNRDLEKEVEQGRFRSDLFFRLNVFPITVPPLRERTEDIPLLVKYFIDIYSKRIGKEVKSIRKNDIEMFMKYNWPGNIRELEHFIERAIIISKDTNLNFENTPIGNFIKFDSDLASFRPLIEIEKEHIVNALKIAKGKITGEKSAAQLLGINGKTLGSRMRKLGIKRGIVIIAEKK